MAQWTLEKKIAQLLVARYGDREHAARHVALGCGGVWPAGMASHDDSAAYREALQEMQGQSEVGLLFCVDFEVGVGQTIRDGTCTEFPALMAFGAVPEGAAWARRAGEIMAEEATWMGLNLAYTPVFDVNTVPENPICNTRAVSDDPQRVAEVAGAMALGMQTGRLLATAKHYPGEGAHQVDPHFGLERMRVSREEMEAVHLPPFRHAAAIGVACVMTNHAIYPAYDDHDPTTTSYRLVTEGLRGELGFTGLVVTDAMEMQGITDMYGAEEAAVRAIAAGHDLILAPGQSERFVEVVAAAVREGRLAAQRIEESWERIMEAKRRLGLLESFDRPELVTPREERWAVAREVGRKSLTLLRDEAGLLPAGELAGRRLLVLEPAHPRRTLAWGLQQGFSCLGPLLQRESEHAQEMPYTGQPDAAETEQVLAAVRGADLVVVGTSFKSMAGQVGLLTAAQVRLLEQVLQVGPPCVFVAGNPYVAAELPFAGTILVNYGPYQVSVEAAVEAIAGRLDPQGRLPVRLPEYLDPAQVGLLAHD